MMERFLNKNKIWLEGANTGFAAFCYEECDKKRNLE